MRIKWDMIILHPEYRPPRCPGIISSVRVRELPKPCHCHLGSLVRLELGGDLAGAVLSRFGLAAEDAEYEVGHKC
jgi:hypothetical protein